MELQVTDLYYIKYLVYVYGVEFLRPILDKTEEGEIIVLPPKQYELLQKEIETLPKLISHLSELSIECDEKVEDRQRRYWQEDKYILQDEQTLDIIQSIREHGRDSFGRLKSREYDERQYMSIYNGDEIVLQATFYEASGYDLLIEILKKIGYHKTKQLMAKCNYNIDRVLNIHNPTESVTHTRFYQAMKRTWSA